MLTPSLDHIPRNVYRKVYEPDSDSFCLMDTLESDFDYILSHPRYISLEVGSGSGIVTAHLYLLYKTKEKLSNLPHLYCIDKNPIAATTTRETLQNNGVPPSHAEVIIGDLTTDTCLWKRGCVDVLYFNPPYVPTVVEEVQGNGIEISCAGGPNGTYVLEQMLPHLIPLLSERGVFYLLFIEQNSPLVMAEAISSQYDLKYTVVFKRYSGERYTVIRFERNLTTSHL
eukprot:PhF_6_TR6710/c0_g1_i1/m.9731/K19589/N6AMT1; release factor glutamine methyltransferase